MGSLGLILLLAVCFRVAGIGSGLPLILFYDEVLVVEHTLAISLKDLNPHVFNWGPLTFYTFKAICAGSAVVWKIIGGSPLSPSQYYLICRIGSAAFSVATVYLVYVLGRLLSGWAAGLLGAALLAVSPLSIDLAHYATADSMMGFWSVLSLVGVASWLNGNEKGRDLAGVALGLAAATKYNAGIVMVPIFIAAFKLERSKSGMPLSRKRRGAFYGLVFGGILCYLAVFAGRDHLLQTAASWSATGRLQAVYVHIFNRVLLFALIIFSQGILVTVAAIRGHRWALTVVRVFTSRSLLQPICLACGTFIITAPFVLLDFPNFARGFFFQVNKTISGGIVSFGPGTRSYVAAAAQLPALQPLHYLQAIQSEWGILVFVAGLIGLFRFWREGRGAFAVFAGLIGPALAMAATWRYTPERYLYQLWGALAVLSAVGGVWVINLLNRNVRHRWVVRLITTAILLIFLAPALASSAREVRDAFILPDSRNLALDWIERHIAPGTAILRDGDTPEIERVSAKYKVYYTFSPFEEGTLAKWRDCGVSVVMVSTARYEFYRAHAAAFQDVLAEYEKLKTQAQLLRTFGETPDTKGPVIYIYSLEPALR